MAFTLNSLLISEPSLVAYDRFMWILRSTQAMFEAEP